MDLRLVPSTSKNPKMDPLVALADVVTGDLGTTVVLDCDAADTTGDPETTVALAGDAADIVGDPETTVAHASVAVDTGGPATNFALLLKLSPCTHVA